MFQLPFTLDSGRKTPLYQQLYESLVSQIRAGALPAGTKLPGKRTLAAQLAVGVNTVDTAYQMLAAEGASHTMWKANARGVDLNVNFDAEWGRGALNSRTPGGSNYIGPKPLSESESRALAAFTLKVRPFVTFSFHTKGGEVYWQFMGGGDRRGAELLAAATGYKIKLTPGSAGGYKDWCIQKLGIPAYTVECGSDGLSHPICRLADISECRSALRYFFLHYGK